MGIYNTIIHNSLKVQQLKCPSVDEWINKTRDSHGGILFSDTKEMLNADTCYNIHRV